MISQVFPHGAVELFDHDDKLFKVNGHRLKPYHESIPRDVLDEQDLGEPTPEPEY